MPTEKSRLMGATVTVKYFCGYKPLKKTGRTEPLNDVVEVVVPACDLRPWGDMCERYESQVLVNLNCPACGRVHTFDIKLFIDDSPGNGGEY